MKKESSRNNISDLELEIEIGDLCHHLSDTEDEILLVLEKILPGENLKGQLKEEIYKSGGYYKCLSSKKRLYTIFGFHLRKIKNV